MTANIVASTIQGSYSLAALDALKPVPLTAVVWLCGGQWNVIAVMLTSELIPHFQSRYGLL
jgi:hypothetical protein